MKINPTSYENSRMFNRRFASSFAWTVVTTLTSRSSAKSKHRDPLQQVLPGGGEQPIRLRMDLNENIVIPPNFIRLVLSKCADQYDPRFYPPEWNNEGMKALNRHIAAYAGCSENCVALGAGADQILDLLIRMKLRGPNTKLVTVEPTFPLYSEFARRVHATVLNVPLRNSKNEHPFSLDKEKLTRACKTKRATICALASPNNPTAIQYSLDDVRQLLESIPRHVTVLLDEAYVEYGRYDGAKNFLGSFPNLVVVRTFSKAFALASLRLGYLMSTEEHFIEEFWHDFQYPYPVSGFSMLMATEMLKRKDVINHWAQKTKEFRAELIGSLSKLEAKTGGSMRVIRESDANFVLVQVSKGKKISEELRSSYGIAVKYYPRLGRESNFLRITVGSRESNEQLLYAIRRLL
jgi:histidinol-phosphate aminotransferase